jgi:hypothetical protein
MSSIAFPGTGLEFTSDLFSEAAGSFKTRIRIVKNFNTTSGAVFPGTGLEFTSALFSEAAGSFKTRLRVVKNFNTTSGVVFSHSAAS